MPFVADLHASSEREPRQTVTASYGVYDPVGGTLTLLEPHLSPDGGDGATPGSFTVTFEQDGLPVTLTEMKVQEPPSNSRELCFVRGLARFAPILTPKARIAGEYKTDLTSVISPLPWADAFRQELGVNAVTGEMRPSALQRPR